MMDADGGGFGDAGKADRGVFQLDRADPFATGFDHVLGAVGQLQRAIGMEHGDIAGIEPVVGVGRRLFGLEVASDHPGPAHLQRA